VADKGSYFIGRFTTNFYIFIEVRRDLECESASFNKYASQNVRQRRAIFACNLYRELIIVSVHQVPTCA